jgi:hypothetical protein
MNRRLLLAISIVLVFAIGVIIWFFIYAEKKSTTTLNEPRDPIFLKTIPKKFQFIFKEDAPEQISTTEITFAKPEVLTQVWNRPATGQTFISETFIEEVVATTTQGTTTIATKKLVESTTTILMFVDRITGYVYGYNRKTNAVYQISNTTMPGIYDAYIFDNGKRIILRYFDAERKTIVSVLASIPKIHEKDQAKPLENIKYLPTQVTSIAKNKDGTLISYLVSSDRGSSVYTINQKETILIESSPFKEWVLSYGGDTLYATTKPSAYLEGQTVRLPFFEYMVGQKTGLMTTPGEGPSLFIHSMWSKTGLKTFISSEGKQNILSIRTIASKCAWGNKQFLVCSIPETIPRSSEGIPDDWFQGRVSFNDSLFTIDYQTGIASALYYFTEEQGKFDITNITLSKENTLLVFTKKQDYTLWLLDTTLIENR